MESHQAQISQCGPSSPAPNLTLRLSSPDKIQKKLSPLSSDGLLITLQRQKDDKPKPFIFKWRPKEDFFNPSALSLFRIALSGEKTRSDDIRVKQKIHFSAQDNQTEPKPFIVRQCADDHVFELGPGKSISFEVNFPDSWRQTLVPGEWYELFWRGAMGIALWDWGSVDEYMGRKLEVKEVAKRIYLRYSSGCGNDQMSDGPGVLMRFTAIGENVNLQRDSGASMFTSPDMDLAITRKSVSSAPMLSVSLEIVDGPGELRRKNGDLMMEFRCKVLYHGVRSTNPATASPITFHSNIFRDELSYRLDYCCRDDDEKWKPCGYRNICLGLADLPDAEVNISHDMDFVSLRPGEIWTTAIGLDDVVWEFPNDLQPGDRFRFIFKGATVEWWDWGSKDQAHTQTVVTVQSIAFGSVVNPPDNGRRPLIVTPPSNQVEFHFAG